jgi:hypothetical protein
MNSNMNTENYWQHSLDICDQELIERMSSFDEYMENPIYNTEDELDIDSVETEENICQENFDKIFRACKSRYSGMEEYMEIPDMQVWLKLKNEIIDFPKTTLKSPFEYYDIEDYYEIDDEYRYKRFKDKWLSSRRRSDSF